MTPPAHILRIEAISAVCAAIVGGVFRAGGHALHQVSLALFGWAAGCAFHLGWMALTNRMRRR